MSYDEFSDKLRIIKAEFRRKHGIDMTSIKELETILEVRLATKPKGRGLKSLRGIMR